MLLNLVLADPGIAAAQRLADATGLNHDSCVIFGEHRDPASFILVPRKGQEGS